MKDKGKTKAQLTKEMEEMRLRIAELEKSDTERKKAEETLKKSEERMRLFFERQLVGMAITSPEKGWLQVNKKLSQMLGYLPKELFLRTWAELTHPDDLAADVAQFNRLLSGEIDQYFLEKRFIRKDGFVINTNVSVGCVRHHDGSVDYVLALLEDITERKQIEESLRDIEARYAMIMNNITDRIWLTDINFRIIWASESVSRDRGYQVEEITPFPFEKLLTPNSLETVIKTISEELTPLRLQQKDLDISKTLELEFSRKDGSTFWSEVKMTVLRDHDGIPSSILGVGRDITDRKRAEDALRENEAKYRLIAENMADVIAILDMNLRYTYISPSIMRLRGFTVDEAMKETLDQVLTPESLKIALSAFEEEMKMEASGTADPDRIRTMELEEYRKDGSIIWVEASLSYLRDKDKKPVGILATTREITERKRAEEAKRSLEERLQRSEKMEALGQLAGGVAHDLNNILGVLTGYSELLLLEIPEGHRSRGHAEKILQSTEKGASIIQDLLTLARRGVTVSDVINLNSVVSGFLKTPVFEKMKDYNPRVIFRTECDKNLLNIKGSPVHLEKTLINLVSNAAESISGTGEVTIRTESRYLDKSLRGYDEVKEGDYAVLTVSDTGMGILAESREKIFEPFYTKKTMGRSGTGLGLAIVWGTVKDHNGYIDVQTKVGEGTTFTLYFPVTREETIAPQQKEPMERYMGNGESVLVVDDIAEQRDVAARLLTRLGYNVRVVASGEEAMEYLKRNKADILVLDMIMAPGIDGLETYQGALAIDPKLKAILVSGFSETERVKETQKLGAGAYVKKPYIMEKIGVAIREELDRK